jgi:hypothetical protein
MKKILFIIAIISICFVSCNNERYGTIETHSGVKVDFEIVKSRLNNLPEIGSEIGVVKYNISDIYVYDNIWCHGTSEEIHVEKNCTVITGCVINLRYRK